MVASVGHQTLTLLERLRIPYDEIHFGQPYAHVYVDSSVACGSINTEKDLGWRLHDSGGVEPGMVAARHFNKVQLEGEYVVKTAARAILRGEMFFYQHMPADIAHLFPTLVSAYERAQPDGPISGAVAEERDAVSSMTLQRVRGVTFSHLVTNRCLTSGRLVKFLEAIL